MLTEQLQSLNVSTICEWDVLAFLYRHATSLTTAEHLAHLVGYSKSIVGAALDQLAVSGLIQRSPLRNRVRLYRFVDSEDVARQQCIQELMRLGETRGGRLLLVQSLRQIAGRRRASAGNSLRLA